MNDPLLPFRTSVRQMLDRLSERLPQADLERIEQAFEFAAQAHADQHRKTGEPYIMHPVAVARIVAEEFGMDTSSIIAAFLHDVVHQRRHLRPLRHGSGLSRAGGHQAQRQRLRTARLQQAGEQLSATALLHAPRHPRCAHQTGRPSPQHAHTGQYAPRQADEDWRRNGLLLRAFCQPPRTEQPAARTRKLVVQISLFRPLRPLTDPPRCRHCCQRSTPRSFHHPHPRHPRPPRAGCPHRSALPPPLQHRPAHAQVGTRLCPRGAPLHHSHHLRPHPTQSLRQKPQRQSHLPAHLRRTHQPLQGEDGQSAQLRRQPQRKRLPVASHPTPR